jgi:hypothetical protein
MPRYPGGRINASATFLRASAVLKNGAMPRLAVDRRAEQYRAHAQELAQASRRAERIEDRRHLIDLATTYMRAADALAPLPPAEPQVFSNA